MLGVRGVPLNCLWFRVSLRSENEGLRVPSLEPRVSTFNRGLSTKTGDFNVSLSPAASCTVSATTRQCHNQRIFR